MLACRGRNDARTPTHEIWDIPPATVTESDGLALSTAFYPPAFTAPVAVLQRCRLRSGSRDTPRAWIPSSA